MILESYDLRDSDDFGDSDEKSYDFEHSNDFVDSDFCR